MDNLENEIKRKISIRKLAIKHMGIQEDSSIIDNDKYEDTEINKLFNSLNNNINEADSNSALTWYWFLNGNKLSVFIKKLLRKSAKTLYGWLLFPIMSRQSHFNGKTVNSINILKDIVSLQQQKIEQLYNELESRIQNNFNEIDNRLQDQINNADKRLQDQINNADKRVHDEIDGNYKSIQNCSEVLDQKLQYFQEQYAKLLQTRMDENKNETENRFEGVDQNINRLRTSVNHFQRQTNPGLRLDVQNKQSIIIDEINDKVLAEKVLQLSEALQDEVNDKLVEVTDYYECKIQHEIEKSTLKTRKLIIIFCLRFKSEFGLEAIKNEAYDLYQLLLKESVYDVKLVSLESEIDSIDYNDEIIYVDKEHLDECFDSLTPALTILIESTPYNVFDYNGLLVRNHTLIKLTGQNPLQNFNEKALDELRHSNDYGVHRYIVESQYAHDVMNRNGFRDVKISYPIINKERILINKNKRDINKTFVVGFASLPMEQIQYSDRGMDLLEETMNHMPDVNFKLLWRNEKLEVPQKLRMLKNCEIAYGVYDIKQFYHEIDCLIIPYKSVDNNHACSLSGIEAMYNNIPIICTNISGISDIVNKVGLGIICESSSLGIMEAINKLRNHYQDYNDQSKVNQLESILKSNKIISIIEDTLEDFFPNNFITLEEWDYHLNRNEKYLVKGHNSIKQYYQNKEIADNYNEKRFLQYPANYYDSFERTSIGIIINNLFNRNDLKILDIASGDGRIVQEDIKYGFCTSIDSSRAMLDIVDKRFSSSGDLKTEICDYFMDTLGDQYDVITTFRYIRHYDYIQRKVLYQKISCNLTNNGVLIFDVPNIKYAMKNREQGNWGNYNIYDVFWDEKGIIKELEENNFEVKYLIPVGVKSIDTDPVSWTVAAVKSNK
jgi:glycosyltransferase involved in cell wall biosynthesis